MNEQYEAPVDELREGGHAGEGVERVAGLARGLSVLESFDTLHPRQTATEAGRRCGLTRTAAKRHLYTLVDLGYLDTDGKQFWLAPAVMRLGHAYLESARLPRLAQPFLQRLSLVVQGTAQVGVMDGPYMIYVARDRSSRDMNTGCVLGERVPAQVTAPGLVLLALQEPSRLEAWLARCRMQTYTPYTMASKEALRRELDAIRVRRWAVSEQQLVLKFRGVAVPLTDREGTVIGALNVSLSMGHESRDDALRRVLGPLNEVAQELRLALS